MSRRLSALIAALLLPAGALAQTTTDGYTFTAGIGVEHSDNRARSEVDTTDDLTVVPRLDVAWLRRGARVEATLAGDFEYRDSLGDDFDDEVHARLAAALNWAIVPQRLYWTLQDRATVEPIDLLAAETPDNRQQTNVLVTGPSLRLDPPGPWSGWLDARWQHSTAEHTDAFDSERALFGARVLYASGAEETWSLGAEHSAVDYRADDPLIVDFDRLDVIARHRRALARWRLDVALGRTWIDRDAGDSLSGTLLAAHLRWLPDERNTWRASVVRELSDAARELLAQIDAEATTIGAVDRLAQPHDARALQLGADLYRLRAVEVEWSHAGDRSEWSLSPFHRDYRYLRTDSALDHNATGADVAAAFALSPRTTLRGELGYERRRFDLAARVDRDMHLGVYLDRRWTRRWSWRIGASRYHRDSTVDGAGYDETVFAVYLLFDGGRS